MNTLQLAKLVAAHPVVVKLRKRQQSMRARLFAAYGDDFMSEHGRDRYEGCHYWTPAEKDAWNALESRLHNVRTALRGAYATV